MPFAKTRQLTSKDNDFPHTLKRLAQPPNALYIKGNGQLLNRPTLGVVGSRAVTPYGKQTTSRLVTEVAWADIVIVSGLALGVDSIAHRSALEVLGKTIAVLPCGIEEVYPASHRQLAQQILEKGGALVSEYQGHQRPQRHHFIARNRIIAGLADAVLITEASKRSGSLHTAQFALEDGKEVMAVPGSIFSPNSAGTHILIASGAQLVPDSATILNFFKKRGKKLKVTSDQPGEQAILDAINRGVSSEQQILEITHQEAPEFYQNLTMLEIKGLVKRRGAQWSLC